MKGIKTEIAIGRYEERIARFKHSYGVQLEVDGNREIYTLKEGGNVVTEKHFIPNGFLFISRATRTIVKIILLNPIARKKRTVSLWDNAAGAFTLANKGKVSNKNPKVLTATTVRGFK